MCSSDLIATGAVTENSSGAARFGGGCVASCARAEPGIAIAESPAAAKFSKRRRVNLRSIGCGVVVLSGNSRPMARTNPPSSFRGEAEPRTRNLEDTILRFRVRAKARPGMTTLYFHECSLRR